MLMFADAVIRSYRVTQLVPLEAGTSLVTAIVYG